MSDMVHKFCFGYAEQRQSEQYTIADLFILWRQWFCNILCLDLMETQMDMILTYFIEPVSDMVH